MEDRHTLSDPRPKSPSNTSLVWLVDIYRKGVSDPVDTIEISNDTLPPRVNKKGKVVWRLPDDRTRLPSFAVNEQRRILDLFKERKKNRKKRGSTKMLNTTNNNVDSDKTTFTNDSGNGEASSQKPSKEKETKDGKEDTDEKKNGSSGEGEGEAAETETKTLEELERRIHENSSPSSSSNKKKKRKKREKKASRRASNASEATGESEPDICSEQQCDCTLKEEASHAHAQPSPSAAPPPPPGLDTAVPPPGFQDSFSSIKLDDKHSPQINRENNDNESFSPPMREREREPPDSNTTNTHASMDPLSQMPLQRYIIIPEIDRPNSSPMTPKTSLVVAAAKTFVDLYYPHITHGLSSDLATYYTPHAQKSISVGGAHSVVASRADIMLQLSKFSGSNFVVRGVVSQDTFDGKGAHILITGVVQTTLTGLTSFAHSVSLVVKQEDLYSFTSTDAPYSFQIHNDALSLLTVSDMDGP
eukprot:CAMPEP_0203675876 /NCGR_PEP_ID=MMETSP0090-20130426/22512_1 /ASSEMBLY_ACC=CAM_ASM_001088 /TAXON_ID=426623 /ORGANISM="Chaetoceros affinis, Strain CCMP159" /LENGTH=472 /DNA_ID=CAMNT_0050542227 /DNA_START=44 /DNA_END=1462 /DNA_ORIENTATION=+